MKFTVEHDGNQAILRFEPRFTTSSGLSWPSLGRAALKRIKIEEWDWSPTTSTLYQYVDGEFPMSDYANMVGAAQAEVTKIMDKLVDWDITRQIFEEIKCRD